MVGLDRKLVNKIDFNKSVERIKSDAKSDFIFAPHLDIIYDYGSQELIKNLKDKLINRQFQCSSPITLDIPKKSRLSRPGSILLPSDRLLYQSLVDSMISEIEANIDRKHVFSNVYVDTPDMFENSAESYNKFRNYKYENAYKYEYCIRMDITSYFESINQHFLINLLDSLGFDKATLRLLEESLSLWSYKNSYSIPQGLYSSDALGNFSLTDLDYFLSINEYNFCRFVDDIYIFHQEKEVLYKLLIELCSKLRKEGLFLNESKTQIKESSKIIIEETEFDRMFDEINAMLNFALQEDTSFIEAIYGFQINFNVDKSEIDQLAEVDGFDLDLVEKLYSKRNEAKWQRDDIVKFCIPLFTKADSLFLLSDIEEEIINNPHLAKYYAAYLATVKKDDKRVTKLIEDLLLSEKLIYDYQIHWILSSLLLRKNVSSKTIDFAVKTLRNRQIHEAIRSICAIVISKFGSGSQVRILRDEYEHEPSQYVKAAILYGTIYRSKGERDACRSAWSGHSELNSLVSKSIAEYNKSESNKKERANKMKLFFESFLYIFIKNGIELFCINLSDDQIYSLFLQTNSLKEFFGKIGLPDDTLETSKHKDKMKKNYDEITMAIKQN